MSTPTREASSVKDLYTVEGKAEIVNGEVMVLSPTGHAPNFAAGEIFFSLRLHAKKTGIGWAVTDNAAFIVNLPHRKTVSPDAAYYVGPSAGAKFFPIAPVFAAEVRSENDYGKRAEEQIQAKIADYFAAGTLVLWDVDVLREKVVRVYRADNPDNPTIYRCGQIAEAEPAVPGWSMPVDDLLL